MNEFEQIQNEIEDLKKELWYLNNKIIPELNGSANDEILTSLQTSIQNLEGEFDEMDLFFQTLQSSVSTNTTDISNLRKRTSLAESQISDLESDLSSLTSNFQSHINNATTNMNSISSQIADLALNMDTTYQDYEERLSTLNSNLNLLSSTFYSFRSATNTSISSINASLSTISNNITTANSNISQNQEDIATLNTQVNSLSGLIDNLDSSLSTHETTCSNSLSSLSTQIEGLSTELGSLSETVANLEENSSSNSGSSGSDWEIIYDKDDPTKNTAFPNGIPPANRLETFPTSTQFKQIRITANIAGKILQQTTTVIRGQNSYVVFFSTSDTGYDIFTWRGYAHKTLLNSVIFGAVYKWTLSSTAGTITMTTNPSGTFYIQRIEAKR